MKPSWIIFQLGVVLLLFSPSLGMAHGEEESEGALDAHHQALKVELQAKLGQDYDRPVPGLESVDEGRGASLFEVHCSGCHGSLGAGDGPESASYPMGAMDLTNGEQLGAISDAGLLEVIRSGLPEGGMPAYDETLTDDELLDVYAFTKTLRVEPPSTTTQGGDVACAVIPQRRPSFPLLFLGFVWWGLARRKRSGCKKKGPPTH